MMKKLALILAVLVAAALPPAASAQQTITLSRMVIEVWPEYDQREALVIYSGQVTDDIAAPLELRITLPATADLNAVAYPAPNGLLQADYTVEGNVVVMTTETGLFHVEFYDPAFTYDQQNRSYSLTYTADYTTNELIWSVQQPPAAVDFVSDPAPSVSNLNNAGLTVAEGATQNLPAGSPFTLSFDYTRTSDTLVVEEFAAQQGSQQPAQQAPAATNTGDGLSTGAIIAIAIGVGLLVGAGIYVVYMGGPQAAMAALGGGRGGGRRGGRSGGGSRGRGSGQRRDKPLTTGNMPKTTFCGQCGERITEGDKFCRHCGAPV